MENEHISKRAMRLAAVQGEIGSNERAKGPIRFDAFGNLQYCFRNPERWVDAVYHKDIRQALIVTYEEQGPYDHKRQRGLGATDITCFHPEQKTWGPNRENRPDILFKINPRIGQVNRAPVSLWYHDNKLVLDQDNNPVRAFDIIPAVCSSQLEGWLMVAILHSDNRIRTGDLRARMPEAMEYSDTFGQASRMVSVPSPNALSMRATRFRMRAGLLPRGTRGGSMQIERYIRAFYPKDMLAKNNSKGHRDLTEEEVREMREPNIGRFGYRARMSNRVAKEEHAEEMPVSTVVKSESAPRLLLHSASTRQQAAGTQLSLRRNLHSATRSRGPPRARNRTIKQEPPSTGKLPLASSEPKVDTDKDATHSRQFVQNENMLDSIRPSGRTRFPEWDTLPLAPNSSQIERDDVAMELDQMNQPANFGAYGHTLLPAYRTEGPTWASTIPRFQRENSGNDSFRQQPTASQRVLMTQNLRSRIEGDENVVNQPSNAFTFPLSTRTGEYTPIQDHTNPSQFNFAPHPQDHNLGVGTANQHGGYTRQSFDSDMPPRHHLMGADHRLGVGSRDHGDLQSFENGMGSRGVSTSGYEVFDTNRSNHSDYLSGGLDPRYALMPTDEVVTTLMDSAASESASGEAGELTAEAQNPFSMYAQPPHESPRSYQPFPYEDAITSLDVGDVVRLPQGVHYDEEDQRYLARFSGETQEFGHQLPGFEREMQEFEQQLLWNNAMAQRNMAPSGYEEEENQPGNQQQHQCQRSVFEPRPDEDLRRLIDDVEVRQIALVDHGAEEFEGNPQQYQDHPSENEPVPDEDLPRFNDLGDRSPSEGTEEWLF
ncbi:hypothetical protein MMC30_005392 [Trapelia coarctata]|nr:hypothetical protein [Trapelia coarctata]